MNRVADVILRISSGLDWFLPRGLVRRTSIDRIRARIFSTLVLVSLLVSVGSYAFFIRPLDPDRGPLLVQLEAGLSLATFILMRLTRRFNAGAFFYLAGAQLLSCLNILAGHSIHSIQYSWLPVRIIAAVMILEASSALWLSLFSVGLTLLSIHVNIAYGPHLPAYQTLQTMTTANLFMLLSAEAVIIFMAVRFENFRRRRQEVFLEERNRIAQALPLYSLGEMVGGVSHEVNNPLAIAMGLLIQCERLAQKPASEVDLSSLPMKFDHALQRMRYVVDGLKTFSQGQLEESVQDETAAHLFQQLRVLNQAWLRDPRLRLRFVDETQGFVFRCRPHQLLRTLQGVLHNAVEATQTLHPAFIEIKILRTRTQLVFHVIDNGPGIPVDLRHRIFEPFFSTKSFKSGQGLTLATAKGLIEAQGGQMLYEPLPKGSCFTIRMPLEPLAYGASHDPTRVSPPSARVWQKVSAVFGKRHRPVHTTGSWQRGTDDSAAFAQSCPDHGQHRSDQSASNHQWDDASGSAPPLLWNVRRSSVLRCSAGLSADP